MDSQNPLDRFFSKVLSETGPEVITSSLSWLGAFVISKDGVIIAANAQFCELLQQDPDDLIGASTLSVITGDETLPMQQRFEHSDSTPYTLKLAVKDGDIKRVRVTPHCFSVHGARYQLAAIRDISRYSELRDTEHQYQEVFSAAGIGIARVNLDGSWLECNKKLSEIVGYGQAELMSMTFQDITHPDDLNEDLLYLQELLSGTRTSYSMEKRYRHKLGHYLWVRLTVTLVKDLLKQPRYFVSLVQDISAEKQAEEASEALKQALEDLSLTDGLTGIGNRRKFDTALSNEWRRASRQGSRVSLIMADIDHFKSYNDEHGHLAGDECLKKIAAVLPAYGNRVSDCIARYGGEEFVILLPDVALADAVRIAEHCRCAVQNLGISRDGDTHSSKDVVTISLGVAEATPKPEDLADVLIKNADQQLYAAKHGGRNQVSPALDALA